MATSTPAALHAHSRSDLFLTLLRLAIGWHFLYEGWAKLMHPGWTSAGFLKSTSGPLSGIFHWLGESSRVGWVDALNLWGLVLIGLALMVGVAVRAASLSGIFLLALYYLAYPPLFAPGTSGIAEGNYLIVNKNLIEMLALAVLASLPPRDAGPALATAVGSFRDGESRRDLLSALAGLPVLGAMALAVLRKHGWKSFEEVALHQAGSNGFVTSPTIRSFSFTSTSELKGRMPQARIGNASFSRMILGGNLIGGWAHARDLIYVSKLVKAYHHRDKVFETFAIAERCGVNTILTNPILSTVINDYWRNGGRIQFISDCGGKDVLTMIQKSIDNGACACYLQGAASDELVAKGDFDTIARALELIRRNKLPAGIGGHKLRTIQACVDKGFSPDFWMKTLHHTNYWSAKAATEHDNIWCENPDDTVAYMRGLPQPWIAFKVLAAGAIPPKIGFRYAFENGADFICVGMYDFQIVEDVNLALDVLNGGVVRSREWRT